MLLGLPGKGSGHRPGRHLPAGTSEPSYTPPKASRAFRSHQEHWRCVFVEPAGARDSCLQVQVCSCQPLRPKRAPDRPFGI